MSGVRSLAGFFEGLFVLSALSSFAGTASAAVINSGFETGDTTGWSTSGQVIVQSDVTYDGDYAVAIGTVDFNDDDYNDLDGSPGTEGYTNNSLYQVVDVAGEDQLSLAFNYFTWDSYDYDEPGFEIRINDAVVLSLTADDIDDTPGLDSTGWQSFEYDLSSYTFDTLELTIYAGNTGDDLVQSWAYIDGLESAVVPVPELDANLGGAALTLLLGGLAVLNGRRRSY